MRAAEKPITSGRALCWRRPRPSWRVRSLRPRRCGRRSGSVSTWARRTACSSCWTRTASRCGWTRTRPGRWPTASWSTSPARSPPVRTLRQRAEAALGIELTRAATAYPPCIPVADARACAYVCEAAGFDDVALVDEVSAAQAVLEVVDGVVVDVGGGSTGVGVFGGGALVALDDRAGGGHHLDLVLAGSLGIGVDEAEPHKRSHPGECLPILVPGLQRIAESVRAMTTDHPDLPLHLPAAR